MKLSTARRFSGSTLRRRQDGVNTLFVTFILLLLTSLVLLYTTRGAITEQRLSANEMRMKQAFAAASAGMSHAMGYLADGGVDHSPVDGAVDSITENSLGTRSYYRFRYCSPSAAAPQCPATHATALTCSTPLQSTEFTTPLVVACGWSDDDSSVIRMTQIGHGTPALPGAVTAPVVSRGTTNLLTGGASVLNYFNDLTVWSGGSVPIQSNTGKTFVRDIATHQSAYTTDANGVTTATADYRSTGNSPSCNNPPTGYQCSTNGQVLGHDTVINDTSLSTLTADEFFMKIMGKDPAVYRDTVASWKVDLNNSLTGENSNSISSVNGMGDQLIWVEGDTSLSGTIGTQDHPVVLVINGNLDLSSNVVINGMVYVTGNVTGNGSPTIYGAMVAAGTVNVTGNVKVVFDPKTLNGDKPPGKLGQLSGSWKDW